MDDKLGGKLRESCTGNRRGHILILIGDLDLLRQSSIIIPISQLIIAVIGISLFTSAEISPLSVSWFLFSTMNRFLRS